MPAPRCPDTRAGVHGSARAGLAALCLTIPIACFSDPEPPAAVVRPVLVHPVEAVSATQERTFPSRAKAGAESALSFRVGGVIEAIHVAVGDVVQQGAAIADLQSDDLMLELRRAEAGLAEATARDLNARSEFERTKRLHASQAASDNQLESAETNAITAHANLEAQQQAVALARSQRRYANLRAPMNGTIAAVSAEVNELVASGEPIVTLNSGGRPEVSFSVPGRLIGAVEKGQPVTVTFAALDDAVFDGEIIEVGVSSDRSAFPVTARLAEADARIRSGLVAETTVRFTRTDVGSKDNVVVPAFAVAEDSKGRFVYVAIPDGEASAASLATIERRNVTTATLSSDGLEVSDGLAVGDLVVTAGLRFVEPGLTVRLNER